MGWPLDPARPCILGLKPIEVLSFWHILKKNIKVTLMFGVVCLGIKNASVRLIHCTVMYKTLFHHYIFGCSASPFFEPILFHFIEEISFWASQVDNFWTPVPVLLLDCTFFAIVGVRDSRTTANYTSSLKNKTKKYLSFQ